MFKTTKNNIIIYLLIIFVVIAPGITSIIHKSKIQNAEKYSDSVVFKSVASEYAMHAQVEKRRVETRSSSELIPKIIHQAVKSKNKLTKENQKSIDSWKKMNPNWIHKLYDERDIQEFMEETNSKVYELWKSLETEEEKLNMWRYVILDTYGGVFSDSNVICLKPLDDLLNYSNASLIVGLDHLIITDKFLVNKKLTDTIQFSYNTIISAPNQELVHQMPYYIYHYIKLEELKVYSYLYTKEEKIFSRTGPGVWTESIFNFLIENGISLEVVKNGTTVENVMILNSNAFSYKGKLDDEMPSDVYTYNLDNENLLNSGTRNEYII